jgi:hypothetical protein
MPEPFEGKLRIEDCFLGLPFETTWGASAGHVDFPSIAGIDWNNDTENKRREQARKTAEHAQENDTMNRSECSWEFDAWRDVFCHIRDDPLLAM